MLFSFAAGAGDAGGAALCRSSGVRHPEWNDDAYVTLGCGLHPTSIDCFPIVCTPKASFFLGLGNRAEVASYYFGDLGIDIES